MAATIYLDETTSVPVRIPITAMPAGTDLTAASASFALTDGTTPTAAEESAATIDGTDIVAIIGVGGITPAKGNYVPWGKVTAGTTVVLLKSDMLRIA